MPKNLGEIGGVSDSPRLTELRRQRALIQEHLAWLDAEIAAEAKQTVPATVAQPEPPPASPAPASPLAISAAASVRSEAAGALAETADAHAEEIMSEYRKPTMDVHRDVRTGCLLYFAAGLILFFAAVAGLYFALRH